MSGTRSYPIFRSPAARMAEAQRACRLLFNTAPIGILVLDTELNIVDANDAYLADVKMRREAVAGRRMFEVFPDSPHDCLATGVRNLRSSFEAVLRSGRADVMPLQRYDIRPDGRPWEVRYWHPKNWAVKDDKGSIIALVHHVKDVTRKTLAQKTLHPPQASASDLLRRADAAIQESRDASIRIREELEISRARSAQILGRRLPR